ncbi:heparinase II/III family protein [Cellulomonas sp. RIT-PI-Y]|uniref:heparinase II/III family protein n=1 Tax=Cellulomonas sp. RIT-PI-Y TaxID=3035297 RepID=UPI0021D95046|nr:heparinase II/III family protein [Cellulomonas sp. RIT-PI-Y]
MAEAAPVPSADDAVEHARGVAARQSFGPHFEWRRTDRATVAEVAGGRIALHPHPVWQMSGDLSWTEDPFDNRNWRAQLHMLRWLEPVRRVAAAGDPAAAALWERYARSWIAHNPPGPAAARSTWSSMVDASRALVLTAGLTVVEDPGWLLVALEEHGAWLFDEDRLGHSNHALHQHEALFVLGTALRRGEWVEAATDRLGLLFAASYDDQGINAEGSPRYHDLNFRWWSRAFERLRREGVPPLEHAARLERAPLALAHATRPDGVYESIGDGDGGRPQGIDHPATRYVVSEGSEGEPPTEVLAVYDQGYAFGRTGWGETDRGYRDETFYSVSFGRADRVHGHPDGGSLTYYAGGGSWVVDPGKYLYGTHPIRDLVESRAAHNVLHVPGRAYAVDARVRLVSATTGADEDRLVLADDGYEGVEVRRTVTFDRRTEALVVVDEVRAEAPVDVQQRWLLAPGVRATAGADGLELARGDDRATLLVLGDVERIDQVSGGTEPHQGWAATGWGTAEPAVQVTVTACGARSRLVSVIVPVAPGAPALPREHWLAVADPSTVEHSTAAGRAAGPADVGSLARAVRDARRSAWREASPDTRTAIAADLATRFSGYLGEDRDLGLRATLTDLLGSDRAGAVPFTADREPLIAWPRTDMLVQGVPVVSAGPDTDFPAGLQDRAVLTVEQGGLTQPFLFVPGEGSVLTVLFHGALDRTRTALPRFERVRTHERFGGPLLAVGDPTLDLDRTLRLGWYLGTGDVDLPVLLAEQISRAAAAVGARQIVLVGASGGGFAAIHVAAHLEGSAVLVINPQTDLSAYFRRLVVPATDAVFGAGSPGPPERTRVLDRLRATRAACRIVYVQNTGDRVHRDGHRDPFLAGVALAAPGVEVRSVEIDSGPGHVTPPPDVYESLWHEACEWWDPAS